MRLEANCDTSVLSDQQIIREHHKYCSPKIAVLYLQKPEVMTSWICPPYVLPISKITIASACRVHARKRNKEVLTILKKQQMKEDMLLPLFFFFHPFGQSMRFHTQQVTDNLLIHPSIKTVLWGLSYHKHPYNNLLKRQIPIISHHKNFKYTFELNNVNCQKTFSGVLH